MNIRIAGIIKETTADGTGIRNSVYFQGCPIHCPGCHNLEYQTFDGGTLMDIAEVLAEISDKFTDGITVLGGEPFAQPAELAELVRVYKMLCPDKTVWVYTGYTVEHLMTLPNEDIQYVLSTADVIVDGPYQQGRPRASFRGSDNQRILSYEDRLKIRADLGRGGDRSDFGFCNVSVQ